MEGRRTTDRRVIGSALALTGLALLFAAAAAPRAPAGRPALRDDARPTFLVSPTRASAWWGGVYPLAGGGTVRLYFSDAYPPADAQPQQWLAFLQGLVHGRELRVLTVYFSPPDVLQGICGRDAYACYATQDQSIATSAEDVAGGPTAEALLEHEYGHHVANNRRNDPWAGVEWGTKRWASYENVCARVRAGDAFPGDEGSNYTLNPGEAFAETYRVLNDTRRSLPATWSLVDPTFAPDATALTLALRDVTLPWSPSKMQIHGALPPRGRSVSLRIATPRDGTLEIRFSASRSASVRISGVPALRRRGSGPLAATICGGRQATVRITTVAGSGPFTLAVARP